MKERVLIAPLDWGLGHAARCVPLIRRELKAGNEVVVAGSGNVAAFLKSTFPDLESLHLEGYGIRYYRGLPAWVSILLQTGSILHSIKREQHWLNELLRNRSFDKIISDNRYGLWSKQVKSVLVTHQLFLQLPSIAKPFSNIVDKLLHRFHHNFDECWIPDTEGADSLSGNLSHGKKIPDNTRFIGWLSRFEELGKTASDSTSIPFDTVVILSGPEPRRTVLENRLFKRLSASADRTLFIQGLPQSLTRHEKGHIVFWPTASDDEIRVALTNAKRIFCRPGYSTLMDLMTLKVEATLIATPGQTEQEHLAELMRKKFGWSVIRESDL
ncbi:MAG: hypothetical protein ACKO1U_01790 [Bacteroidota bacterium]